MTLSRPVRAKPVGPEAFRNPRRPCAALAKIGWLVFRRFAVEPPEGVPYGNIEIRQVDLAFQQRGAGHRSAQT